MRVLITGHAGFVGSHLWRACTDRGDSVVGVDTRYGAWQDCRTYFRDNPSERFDLVLHCAATVGGRATIDGDPLGVATNLSLDAEMFNWAIRARPGRVVYFSSSAAYPLILQDKRGRVLGEGDVSGEWLIGRPDQTYGWAKLTGEMLADHARAAGVRVHVVRPFSGYGEDQELSYPFPAFLRRAAGREDPFTVWGDGLQVRDFVHVDDIVGAVFAVVDQDVPGPANVCTGRPMSMDGLARMVCQAVGYDPALRHEVGAPTGVAFRVGDPTLLETFYKPRVSLEEGVQRGVRALDA
jgi:nucleoside-diphosphate-sugar epimerase